MKFTHLGIALTTYVPLLCHAAALEVSEQSIRSFTEPENYAELSYAEIYANVSGQIQNQEALKSLGISNFSTGNFLNNKQLFNAAIKFQLTPKLSFGILYDHPYGVDIDYDYRPQSYLGQHSLESMRLKFSSQNISMLTGYQPYKNLKLFVGASYQEFDGDFDIWGKNYSFMSGYHAQFHQNSGHGWLTGIDYQIPEYGFKTTLSYRSKITHKSTVSESILDHSINLIPFEKTHITTPQSINFDFQTAVNAQNIVYSTLRWVNWKDFYIQPTQFNAIVSTLVQQYPNEVQPFHLISYQKNQWSGKLGLAHILNDRWIVSSDINWDSGTGNSISTLNPSDGFYGLGLNTIYKFHKKSFIAYGLKYFRLNKAKQNNSDTFNPITQSSSLSSISSNQAFAHGIKIGYYF